jgi:hypothetical protein
VFLVGFTIEIYYDAARSTNFRLFYSSAIGRFSVQKFGRLQLKCDGTRAENIFRLSAKQTSPFKSAGESVQSATGSRGVHISCSNAGYTKFRGSVNGTGYPLHSAVSPSLPLPCVTVCHHVSTGLYPNTKTHGTTFQKTAAYTAPVYIL